MKKIKIFIFSILSLNLYSQVQIGMNPTINNPSYLIDNVLIGNGVTTTNHSFIGDSSQIGYFSDTNGIIGFHNGFILSTGTIDSIGNVGSDTIWWNYIWDSSWTNIIDSTPVIQGHFLSSLLTSLICDRKIEKELKTCGNLANRETSVP